MLGAFCLSCFMTCHASIILKWFVRCGRTFTVCSFFLHCLSHACCLETAFWAAEWNCIKNRCGDFFHNVKAISRFTVAVIHHLTFENGVRDCTQGTCKSICKCFNYALTELEIWNTSSYCVIQFAEPTWPQFIATRYNGARCFMLSRCLSNTQKVTCVFCWCLLTRRCMHQLSCCR